MGKRPKAPAAARPGASRLWAATLGVLLVAGGGLYVSTPYRDGAGASAPVPAVGRRETRPTLDPSRFVGKAAAAHRVAREIPGVLDQLYCYCECDKSIGHRSLLSCYTDGHAAT